MSQFSGSQSRGAMRKRRIQKRKEAEARNKAYQDKLKKEKDSSES